MYADDHAEQPVVELQSEVRPAKANMFFNIYFLMPGLDGIHVGLGIVVITWLLILSGVLEWTGWRWARGRFGPHYFTPVDLGGLYWHIVDLIWIFLFPLFYLI